MVKNNVRVMRLLMYALVERESEKCYELVIIYEMSNIILKLH